MAEIIYKDSDYEVSKSSNNGNINVFEIYLTDDNIVDLGKSKWLYSSDGTVGDINDLPNHIRDVIIREKL